MQHPEEEARRLRIKQPPDEIRALTERVRRVADEGQYEEARSILDSISGIYPECAPLDAERERIATLQEKAKFARSKARRVIGIRKALAQRNFEGTRRELQIALEEFPKDDELLGLQNELTEIEHKTKEAHVLYEAGRRQVAAQEYGAGIETLRRANDLNPNSRPIEMALFNALVQFAKNIVDFEPKRAKHLLDEAARLSPLNLTLESAARYLSDRIRKSALNDCRRRVHILRDQGQIIDALKLVSEVANKHQLHDDPALEQIRSDIWIDFGIQQKRHKEDADSNGQSEPKREAEAKVQIEPAPAEAAVLMNTRSKADRLIAVPDEFHNLSASVMQQTRKALAAIGTWEVRERSRRTLERVAAEGRAISARTREWHELSRSAFGRLSKGYKIGTGAVCLLMIVAMTFLGTSLRRQPELTSVGTATMLSSVTLVREPSASSPVSGSLKIGQSVEILTQLPAMTLDAWTLIRPIGNKQINGYARLQNLDRIKTGKLYFDLWHAMTFLNRSSRVEELESRLANIDYLLKSEAAAPSADTDAILLKLSKTVTGLAFRSQGDPENSGRLLRKAELYLSLIAGTLQLSDEAYELKESIQKAQITLEDASSERVSTPPSTRGDGEETRITSVDSSRRP